MKGMISNMRKYERLMYLLVILGLVIFMAKEFGFFIRHYAGLLEVFDFAIHKCSEMTGIPL